jgi:hypothetical protein
MLKRKRGRVPGITKGTAGSQKTTEKQATEKQQRIPRLSLASQEGEQKLKMPSQGKTDDSGDRLPILA